MNPNVRVIARNEDGTETDVTEGVQALYDHCVSSMDWGSGFLSVEDAHGIITIAQTCGFLVPDTAAAAFEDYARRMGIAGMDASNIICATCGEKVRYSMGYGRDMRPAGYHGDLFNFEKPKGWHHIDHDPGHPVVLWR